MNKRGTRKQDRTMKSHRINRPLKNGCKSFTANIVWSFYRISKLTSTFQGTFNIRIIIFQSKKKENTWNHIVCMCIPYNTERLWFQTFTAFHVYIFYSRNTLRLREWEKRKEWRWNRDSVQKTGIIEQMRYNSFLLYATCSHWKLLFFTYWNDFLSIFFIFHEHSSSHRAYAC